MAEKRFTITGNRSISDHQKKRLYDLSDFDGMISVTECLNELSDENEQLRKDVARYRGNFREMEDVKCELAEENEQLKKRIDRIDIILDDLNGAEYISRDDAIKALNKIDKVVR